MVEGARLTQVLIIVSRVRRRDMARSFDSGEGSSVSDSVRLVSMPTIRSSAVLRWRVRMSGLGGRLKLCEFALWCERARKLWDTARKKSNNISARPRTNHHERPGHVSAIHLNISFLCFRLRLATSTWAWSWALTWAISCFFSRNSNTRY